MAITACAVNIDVHWKDLAHCTESRSVLFKKTNKKKPCKDYVINNELAEGGTVTAPLAYSRNGFSVFWAAASSSNNNLTPLNLSNKLINYTHKPVYRIV